MSVVQSERGLEGLFPIWETMAPKVDPFVLTKLFNDPRNTRFLFIYARECGEAIDALTNDVQFRAHGNEFGLASSIGLTDGDEAFPFRCRIRRIVSSGTNEGGQGWGVRRNVEMEEILLAFPIRATERSVEIQSETAPRSRCHNDF